MGAGRCCPRQTPVRTSRATGPGAGSRGGERSAGTSGAEAVSELLLVLWVVVAGGARGWRERGRGGGQLTFQKNNTQKHTKKKGRDPQRGMRGLLTCPAKRGDCCSVFDSDRVVQGCLPQGALCEIGGLLTPYPAPAAQPRAHRPSMQGRCLPSGPIADMGLTHLQPRGQPLRPIRVGQGRNANQGISDKFQANGWKKVLVRSPP